MNPRRYGNQILCQLTQPTSGSRCSKNLALHYSGVTYPAPTLLFMSLACNHPDSHGQDRSIEGSLCIRKLFTSYYRL